MESTINQVYKIRKNSSLPVRIASFIGEFPTISVALTRKCGWFSDRLVVDVKGNKIDVVNFALKIDKALRETNLFADDFSLRL